MLHVNYANTAVQLVFVFSVHPSRAAQTLLAPYNLSGMLLLHILGLPMPLTRIGECNNPHVQTRPAQEIPDARVSHDCLMVTAGLQAMQ